jgi:hypothetical protein
MPPLSSAPLGAHPILASPHGGMVRMELPPGVELEPVLADLADDGVSVTYGGEAAAEAVPGLRAVVDEAARDGLDLKIVVVDRDPGWLPTLRDLATEVGANEGGTVLVLSPNFTGSASETIPRIELQSGEFAAMGKPSVQAAEDFLESVQEPGFPWTALTLVLLAVVAVAVASTVLLRRRSV